MKKTTLALVAIVAPLTCVAETSANLGWSSEYIYRGIPQADSSAYAGLDYERAGFYVGTWAADVDQGAEVDLYFGYNGEFLEGLTYGVGAIGYFYTDDFDDTYKEVVFSLAYGPFSLDSAFGEYENFAGPTKDYTFTSFKWEHKGFYALMGTFGRDFDGEYFEAGYGVDVAGMDVSVSLVHGTSALLGDEDNTIVFSIGKSLQLGGGN